MLEVADLSHFFGEEICWIESSRDVHWLHFVELHCFTDATLAHVELAHVFVDRFLVDPGHSALVVTVEEGGGFGNVLLVKVFKQVAQSHDQNIPKDSQN